MHQNFLKSKSIPVKKKRRIRLKSDKKVPIRKLIKRLDLTLSRFVRQSAADHRGMARCFTCDALKPWEELQNGHYISRVHHSLRFDIRNLAPQCVRCNIFLHGNMDVYALRLQEKYGDGILRELNQLKQQTKQWTREELFQLISKYEKIY